MSGETSRGVANMVVDWSLDGANWNYWGDINLEEAPGSENYFGETGPDFEGLVVRYLLLSVTSNHGGNCYGFSEVKLDVSSFMGCAEDIVPNGMIDINDVLSSLVNMDALQSVQLTLMGMVRCRLQMSWPSLRCSVKHVKKEDSFAFCFPVFGHVLARPHKSTLWTLEVIEGLFYLSRGPNRRAVSKSTRLPKL